MAVSEMCIGGRLGATIDIDGTGEGDVWGRLWGESLGRIVVAVPKNHEPSFLDSMKGHAITVLGEVNTTKTLEILDGVDELISLPVDQLVTAWKGTLDLTGGVV